MIIRYYWIIKAILILIPIVALGYFGYRYINPSGTLEINYDFCNEATPYMSGLSPNGRVLDIEELKAQNPKPKIRCLQRMVIDPVYFDVRLPQSYRKVTLEVTLDKDPEQEIGIGVGIDPDNWKWEFDNSKSRISNLKSNNEVYYVYETELDLSDAKFEDNRYRFIISSPGLDGAEEKVTFYNVKLRFEKPPLTRENLLSRVVSLLKRQ